MNREVLAQAFERHDFAFKWSYAEMAALVEGLGFDWCVDSVAKCIQELVLMTRPHEPLDDGARQLDFSGEALDAAPNHADMQVWRFA